MTDSMRQFSHREECMGTFFAFAGRTGLPEEQLDAAIAAACEELHWADRM
ncbi:MAG: hypothetical protein RLZ88_764, partial [Actinomycetota bacterium]